MTSAAYQVTGMTCEHCVHAVTGELKDLGGVSDVTVDLVPGGRSVVTSPATRRWPLGRWRPPLMRPAVTGWRRRADAGRPG